MVYRRRGGPNGKFKGMTEYDAIKYRLWVANYGRAEVQIRPWIEFILIITIHWLFMFVVSCLPVVSFKRFVQWLRTNEIEAK